MLSFLRRLFARARPGRTRGPSPPKKSATARSVNTDPVPLRVRVGCASDTGLQREHNEDRCLVQELGRPTTQLDEEAAVGLLSSAVLIVVADGMGGAVAGEIASGVAVETLAQRAETLTLPHETQEGLLDWLVDGATEANRRTLERIVLEPQLEGMGSTLTAAVLVGDTMFVAHVGDSRAYHVREGKLQRVTSDHSFVGRLVALGRITEEQARNHEHKNLLLRALGSDAELEVEHAAVTLGPGDRVLLCSDGLSNLVEDPELLGVLTGEGSPREQCAALVATANARGGDDNITVVIAHFASTVEHENGEA